MLTAGINTNNKPKRLDLTNRPLLIQTPLSKAMRQPNLVVLVSTPPGGLEDLDAGGQFYVVFVVVAPGS